MTVAVLCLLSEVLESISTITALLTPCLSSFAAPPMYPCLPSGIVFKYAWKRPHFNCTEPAAPCSSLILWMGWESYFLPELKRASTFPGRIARPVLLNSPNPADPCPDSCTIMLGIFWARFDIVRFSIFSTSSMISLSVWAGSINVLRLCESLMRDDLDFDMLCVLAGFLLVLDVRSLLVPPLPRGVLVLCDMGVLAALCFVLDLC